MEFISTHLSNGLQVTSLQRPHSPLAHIAWNVHSGSAHEPIHGLAHLCEHLMFLGTPSFPNYDEQLSELAAENNATTCCDATSYTVSLSAPHLETLLHIEADRICHMADFLSLDIFEREKSVVRNEYHESFEEDPLYRLYHQQQAALFGSTHPYGHPVIGELDTINSITIEDCRSFIRGHYCTTNISVCISSPYPSEHICALMEKHWHKIPSQSPNQNLTPSIPESVICTHTLKTTIKEAPAFVSFDWIISSTEIIVARVLSILLNSAQYGLLYKKLELQKKWVSDLEVEVDARRGPSIFSIQGYLNKETFRIPFEQEILETLNRVSQAQFPEHFHHKSTKKLQLMWLQALEGSASQHEQLTSWLIYNPDPHQLAPHIEAHACVRICDVQQFAKKLLHSTYLSSHNYDS